MPSVLDTRSIEFNPDELQFESEILSILGRAFQTYPSIGDIEWFSAVAGLELSIDDENSDFVEGCAALKAWHRSELEVDAEGAIDRLAVEHTGLFIGPSIPSAPPWGSLYLDKEDLLFQESTRTVRRWYRRYGLEPQLVKKEPDDHAGLELTFLGVLSDRILQALSQEQPLRAAKIRRDQFEFLSTNIGTWGDEWIDRVLNFSSSDYYRGLALITRGVLKRLKSHQK